MHTNTNKQKTGTTNTDYEQKQPPERLLLYEHIKRKKQELATES